MSCFHKVVRRHYSGEVGKFIIFWCEIYSRFCVHTNYENRFIFCWVIQNITGGVFWHSVMTREKSELPLHTLTPVSHSRVLIRLIWGASPRGAGVCGRAAEPQLQNDICCTVNLTFGCWREHFRELPEKRYGFVHGESFLLVWRLWIQWCHVYIIGGMAQWSRYHVPDLWITGDHYVDKISQLG